MTVESLSPETKTVVRAVLVFILTTSHLDGEFKTRLGVARSEIAKILMRWPAVDALADDASAIVAISNSFNEVVNALTLSAEEWQQLGATRTQVESAYAEWATKRGMNPTGLR